MQELIYIRCGDYYIPDIRLPEENRPIGRWDRMHRDYLMEHNTIRFNDLCLSGELWTYLADLNEQPQSRLELIVEQPKAAEGVTESMKSADQMAWIGAMNSIRNRAEEIVKAELIYNRYRREACVQGGTSPSVTSTQVCLMLPKCGSSWSDLLFYIIANLLGSYFVESLLTKVTDCHKTNDKKSYL